MEFTSLVVAGGSIRVLSFVGCLRYMEENDMMKHLRNFVGTSAGAVLCFALTLGYTSDEMRDVLKEHLCGESGGVGDFTADDFLNLFSRYGVDQGNKLVQFIEMILFKKTGRRDITFIELAKWSGFNLVVCVTNLTKERYEFFGVDETPNMSVVVALRITCSIPFVFTPVTINGDIYLDGCLLNNFPLNYFKEDRLQDILGLNIKNKDYNKTDNFLQYVLFVINCVMENMRLEVVENSASKNILTVAMDSGVFNLNSVLPDDVFEEFIQLGYDAMQSSDRIVE